MNEYDILSLANRYHLDLSDEMKFNEMGLDFRIVFAKDSKGVDWVLRIPRRNNQSEQINHEGKILELLKSHLSVAIPDWKIFNSEFIAYPMLENHPVITFDPNTYELNWNIEKENNIFVPSLSSFLIQLHKISCSDAVSAGISILPPEKVRENLLSDIKFVKQELGMEKELETRWRTWINNDKLWPNFSVLVHGDLYAGHILAERNGNITGVIDWSEVEVNDPSIDFTGHLAVFGEESLKQLLNEYEKGGGKVWDRILEHTIERHSASPLKFAAFALKNGNDTHISQAKAQLGF